VRRDLLAESKQHQAWKRLCGIPSIGPIRAAVLLGILQTPNRFRTKRQLWTYGGVGIETSSSADHHVVKGQLERKKKQVEIRGLNRNYNHDLKNLFKGAAIVAATKPGPFADFYAELLAKGMRQEMARRASRKQPACKFPSWRPVAQNRPASRYSEGASSGWAGPP